MSRSYPEPSVPRDFTCWVVRPVRYSATVDATERCESGRIGLTANAGWAVVTEVAR